MHITKYQIVSDLTNVVYRGEINELILLISRKVVNLPRLLKIKCDSDEIRTIASVLSTDRYME